MYGIVQGSNEPIKIEIDGIVDKGYDCHAVLKWENQILKEWSNRSIQVQINGNTSIVTLLLDESETIRFPDVTARLLLKWTNEDTTYIEFMSEVEVPIIKYDDLYEMM